MAAAQPPAREAPALDVRELVRTFGAQRAVDALSFEVRRGETFGLLGHNGAGKTTTIRLVNGVLARDAGEVRVLGLDPATHGEAVRARTGVLTETPSIDERLTATENLAFFARLHGLSGRRLDDQVAAVLAAFGLTDRADDRVGGYSRGMKQRVALARTLLHDPDILFLDEPTAALDPVAAREVHELVEGFRRDERRTVILTTHNLVEAQRLCDRVVILQRGRAVALGTPAELARSVRAAVVVTVEVAADQRAAAMAVGADAVPGASAIPAAEDGRFTVPLPDREAIPVLVAALVRASIAVYHVGEETPDLETAYFAITGAPAGGR